MSFGTKNGLIVCLRIYKKAKFSRRSELREFWIKTNRKSFREVTFTTCLASSIPDYIPPENFRAFSIQLSTTHIQHLRSHKRSTWSSSTDILRTSQSTSKTGSDTRRHTTTHHRRERGGSERELAYGADAGRWAFWVALCPCLHFMSMHARTYERGLHMPECYQSWLIHGHFNACTAAAAAVAAARRFEVAAVYVPGIIIISSWVPNVLDAKSWGTNLRLGTTVDNDARRSMLLLVVLLLSFSCYADQYTAHRASDNNNKQQCCWLVVDVYR